VTTDRHAQQFAAFFQEALEHMRALTGVRDAALTTHLPLSIPNAAGAMLTVKVAPGVRLESAISFASVSPGYFETTRQTLTAGRFFEERDRNL